MRNEIKTSFNALFEKEQLNIKVKQTKHRRLPIIVACSTLALACLIWLTLTTQTVDEPPMTASTESIFQLKNGYIGSPVNSTNIAKYVLPDMPLDHISLQTKEEPYGITFYLTEDISAAEKVKYSFYSFALIQNHMNVTFEAPSFIWTANREELAKDANVDFQAIENEQQLLNAYYEYALPIFDVPRIFTHEAEHLYKLFFNVAMKSTPIKKALPVLPHYVFYVDEVPYYLWVLADNSYIVPASDALQVKRVPKEMNKELLQFLKAAG